MRRHFTQYLHLDQNKTRIKGSPRALDTLTSATTLAKRTKFEGHNSLPFNVKVWKAWRFSSTPLPSTR